MIFIDGSPAECRFMNLGDANPLAGRTGNQVRHAASSRHSTQNAPLPRVIRCTRLLWNQSGQACTGLVSNYSIGGGITSWDLACSWQVIDVLHFKMKDWKEFEPINYLLLNARNSPILGLVRHNDCARAVRHECVFMRCIPRTYAATKYEWDEWSVSSV